MPTAARFCPGCGTAVADGGTAVGAIGPAGNDEAAKRRLSARVLGIFGAIIILGLIAAAALIVARRQPAFEQTAIVPAGAPQEKAPGAKASGESSAKPAPQAAAGFDWSGLTAEQLLAARAALDEAIAKEEKSALKGTSSGDK